MVVWEYVRDLMVKFPPDEYRTRPIIVTSLTTLVIGGYALYRWTRKKYNLPPGPRGWPIFGSVFEFSRRSKDLQVYLHELKDKYGEVVFLKLGPIPTVILFSAAAVREAFIHNGYDCAGRQEMYMFDVMSAGYKSVALGQPTPLWKVQRRILHDALKTFSSGPALEELLQKSMDKVKSVLLQSTDPFDPKHVVNLLLYNIMASMTFGEEYELDDPFIKELSQLGADIPEACSSLFPADVCPAMRYVPFARQKTYERLLRVRIGIFADALQKHRLTFDEDNVSDFTYQVLAMQKEVAQSDDPGALSQLTEDHYVHLINDLFTAGVDNTRVTLLWVIAYMVKYPDVQRQLQAEVDKVTDGSPRDICLADRDRLPYTYAVIHEVLRMRTPVPMYVPHKTLCDTKIGGYDIPANTQVIANAFAIHNDPKDWPEPEEFKPERFLDEDGKFATKPAWLPFSTGRRVCVGEAFVKLETHLLVAELFHKFVLTPAPGEEGNISLKPQSHPFLVLSEDYKIVATPRL